MTARLALASLLLAAACGSAHHTIDANRDTSTDTIAPAMGDAPAGAVTVTVTSSGVPAPNVTVYFQNADSSLVVAATTDAHGSVGAMLATGGFVTVIEPQDGTAATKLDTWAGVHAGDALHLDLSPAPSSGNQTTTLTVSTDMNAFGYQVYTPCGMVSLGSAGSGPVALPGCASTTDFLVVATDMNALPFEAYYAPNVTIGGMTDISGPAYVDMSMTQATFNYAGVPSTITYIGTTQELWAATGRLFTQSASSAVMTQATPPDRIATNTLDQPAPMGLTAVTVTDAIPDSSPNGNQHGEQLIFDWATWAPSYSLKVDSVLLKPYLTDAKYALDTHSITWTEGSGVQPDFVRARIVASRDAIPDTISWQWSIVAPREAMPAIAFPKLPVNDFDYNPTTGDLVAADDLTSVKAPGGYDSFRANAFTDVKSLVLQGSSAPQKLVVQMPFTSQL